MQDSNVAIQCREENSVGWFGHKTPERLCTKPHEANKLIIAAFAGHDSAVHFDNSVQHHEEWRTHVHDALIYHQNVHRLQKRLVSDAEVNHTCKRP